MSNNDRPQQLFIGNLSYDANETDIRDTFADLNIVIGDVRIVIDNDSGKPKGFAFVDIDPNCALSIEEIASSVNGADIAERPCRASPARPRPERTRTQNGGGPARRNNDRRAQNERPARSSKGRRMGASVWDD